MSYLDLNLRLLTIKNLQIQPYM
uniref:Uncharacterized protein n=1 Tax=Arundo donax TaxID=35708 RepID=A0A0A9EXK2_ARUDO